MANVVDKYRDKDIKYKEMPTREVPHTAEEIRAVWDMIERRKKEDKQNRAERKE